jgi:hypothetical protein
MGGHNTATGQPLVAPPPMQLCTPAAQELLSGPLSPLQMESDRTGSEEIHYEAPGAHSPRVFNPVPTRHRWMNSSMNPSHPPQLSGCTSSSSSSSNRKLTSAIIEDSQGQVTVCLLSVVTGRDQNASLRNMPHDRSVILSSSRGRKNSLPPPYCLVAGISFHCSWCPSPGALLPA